MMLMRYGSILVWCWCWSLMAADTPRELVIVSWNVLAEANEREQRLPVLLAQLRAAHPDVIAIQEATTWFVSALSAEPWAKDLKRVSGSADQPFPGGMALFTALPVLSNQVIELPTTMGRCGIVVEVALPQGPLSFGVVHLDSYLEDGPIRSRQLRAMGMVLQGRAHAVLLGDFNFGDGAPEATDQPAGMVDVWPLLHGDQPGFTWDIERSVMAKRGSFPHEPSRRLDRIVTRSPLWRPTAITLLGTDPVPDTKGEIFPSDHFGVRVVLSVP